MVAVRASVFIVLCCGLNSQLVLVEGLYVLQTQIHGFVNTNQQSFHCNQDTCWLACCDDGNRDTCSRGERRCDTFFIFCLRPSGTTGLGCGSNGGSVIRSNVNENDEISIDFSRGSFLGLSNPVNLPGLTNDWNVNGIQLHILVVDEDTGSDIQLIAAFLFPFAQQVNSSHRETMGNSRAIDVTITVICAQNFTGSDCTQCIRGLTGSMCNETDDCVNVTCSGRGQCLDGVDSFTCNCNPGFTGAECEDNINECIDPGVNCSGNGQCVDEFGSYSCNCSAGYNGTDCEINIDDCSPNPCGANGQCIDGVDSFTCNCIPGYTGTQCDAEINECMPNPCGTNGQCVDGVNTFNCSCNPGFTGDLCQTDIDECVGVNCSGNGVCVDGVNSFTCQEIGGSSIQAGPIVGGVLGVLISLILILIIVIAVVLTVRCLNRQGKENIQGRTVYSDTLPGDNPVYDRGNTAVTLGGLTQASAPVHYVNLSSSDRDKTAGSAPDRVFDNPIYGGNDEETEDTYADPDANHHAGTGMGSAPYHEFDNPIYGGEADENTYSLLADSSTENAYSSLADSTVNGTAASTGQAVYTNSKIGTHHWQ